MEGEWVAQSARTGMEALALAQQFNFAVVVADVVLPDMSGLELLDQFMQRQPSAHRLVLSDVSDTENTVKCMGKPHHHLLKPFGVRTLLNALEQAFAHEVWLPSQAVHGLIAQMRQVPSPPTTYFKVVEEIRSPNASLERIGELIAEDPAITAKVLQLANSAVFGLQLQVSQPLEAIAYIGLETTKALVLLAHTVSSFDKAKLPGFSVEALWRHSFSAGQMAQKIALMEKGGLEVAEQAFAGRTAPRHRQIAFLRQPARTVCQDAGVGARGKMHLLGCGSATFPQRRPRGIGRLHSGNLGTAPAHRRGGGVASLLPGNWPGRVSTR